MTFDKIIEDGRLWSVHYKDQEMNELERVFTQWNDAEWLLEFFQKNDVRKRESAFRQTSSP